VELVEGLLVRKMTIYPPHAYAVHKLNVYFQTKNLPGWIFRSQLPITLADGEPEPDGAIVRGVADDYSRSHPREPHVGLVIEVSDTSLIQDRGVKKRSYARAGIPAYWIVNIPERTLEVYTDPFGEDYRSPTVYRPGHKAPVVLADAICAEFEVSSLFVE
jgi:Uma2 family endonuclease